MDTVHGERADAELNRMIERRPRTGEDPEEREELWKGSVRRYNARRREEMRAAWCEYHQGQAERHRRTLRDLIAHHETQVEMLCEEARP